MLRCLSAVIACGVGSGTFAQPVALPPPPPGVATFTAEGIAFARVRADKVPGRMLQNGNVPSPIGAGTWDFAIARTELTQGQWVEFVNAFNAVPIPQHRPWTVGVEETLRGDLWVGPGVFFTRFGPQGRPVYEVTGLGAVLPVSGIGWFGAALYSNWLHNARQASAEALTAGAYDLRSFDAYVPATWPLVKREPAARFWIPSYDEWAVASFYDPNRSGPGQGGWWSHLNGRERPGIPGAPGKGETSAGWLPPGPGGAIEASLIPVASYPESQSPWGLLDTSGSRREVLDDRYDFGRRFAGTRAGPFLFPELEVLMEQIGWAGAESPHGGSTGVRIASATVPAAPTLVVAFAAMFTPRRRRP